jgi:hypothetical protein
MILIQNDIDTDCRFENTYVCVTLKRFILACHISLNNSNTTRNKINDNLSQTVAKLCIIHYKYPSCLQILNLENLTTMAKQKQSMSDVICELHSLSLRRLTRDDNQCLLLVKCHECNSQLRQIWELRKIPT